jgi:hypothetical protein
LHIVQSPRWSSQHACWQAPALESWCMPSLAILDVAVVWGRCPLEGCQQQHGCPCDMHTQLPFPDGHSGCCCVPLQLVKEAEDAPAPMAAEGEGAAAEGEAAAAGGEDAAAGEEAAPMET